MDTGSARRTTIASTCCAVAGGIGAVACSLSMTLAALGIIGTAAAASGSMANMGSGSSGQTASSGLFGSLIRFLNQEADEAAKESARGCLAAAPGTHVGHGAGGGSRGTDDPQGGERHAERARHGADSAGDGATGRRDRRSPSGTCIHPAPLRRDARPLRPDGLAVLRLAALVCLRS